MTPYQWIPINSTGKVSGADAIGWYSLKKKKKELTPYQMASGTYIHTHTHTHIYIYIYIYITCLAKWKLLLFASLVQRHIPPLHVGHNPIYLIPCVSPLWLIWVEGKGKGRGVECYLRANSTIFPLTSPQSKQCLNC